MKKYFAIYCPIEGEIEENDKAFWNIQTNRVFAPKLDDKNIDYWKKLLKMANKSNHKPAKLFLCTRDIQVGNEAYYKGAKAAQGPVTQIDLDSNTLWINNAPVTLSNYYPVKSDIIGEISPDALSYVKEWDEFDEDEVHVVGENSWGEWHPICLYKKGDNPKIYCEIKGPCGHYH